MEVRCIKHFADCEPGDIRVVPDGSVVAPAYFEVVSEEKPAPLPAGETDDTDLDPFEDRRRKQIRELQREIAALEDEDD